MNKKLQLSSTPTPGAKSTFCEAKIKHMPHPLTPEIVPCRKCAAGCYNRCVDYGERKVLVGFDVSEFFWVGSCYCSFEGDPGIITVPISVCLEKAAPLSPR